MDDALFSLDGASREIQQYNFSELENGIGVQIGVNLRDYRLSVGHTQQKHAKLMGVSLSQYRKYETGVDIPRYHTACRWGMATGASFYNLLLNTPYQELLPSHLVAWKLIPFGKLVGRLSDSAYLGLVRMVGSLEFTQEIIIPKPLDSDLGCVDFALAFDELETESYAMNSLNIRLLRQSRHYSQEQMAELLGVNINTYRNYETSALAPKFSMLFAVRFFLVFGQHLSSLTPDSLFYQYLQQYLRRLSYLAPTLYQVNKAQYQQLRQLFRQVEVIAEGNDAFIF